MKQTILPKIPYTIWKRECWSRNKPFFVHCQADLPNWEQPSFHVHKIGGVYFGWNGIHKHSIRVGAIFMGSTAEILQYHYINGVHGQLHLKTHDINKPLHFSFEVHENYTELQHGLFTSTYQFGLNKGKCRPANPYIEPAPNKIIQFDKYYSITNI